MEVQELECIISSDKFFLVLKRLKKNLNFKNSGQTTIRLVQTFEINTSSLVQFLY